MNITNEYYVDTTGAAQLLGVCTVTMYRWIKRADKFGLWRPKPVQLAQAKYWLRSEVLAFGKTAGRR